MRKILFISPYPPGQVPSQRFRYEQYLSQLQQNGFFVVAEPFFSEKAFVTFYQTGNLLSKIYAFTYSYVRRMLLLFRLSGFDFVFIHREGTPLGPPIVEYIIANVLGKKIIYDFDDAIWLTDKADESAITRWGRWRSKVAAICRWSYKISCGNRYLAEYALQFNLSVFVIPTTIDTDKHNPLPTRHPAKKISIGWTGSRSTLKYLKDHLPVLLSVEKKYPETQFIVIADEDPKLPLKHSLFIPWEKDSEIEDLAAIDIGIMPLPDDAWTRGKCGFKALQYMAMGIPALVSPVGVNKEIVKHGTEGYWCSTSDEWFVHLEELIRDSAKRVSMGQSGRRKVIEHYSVSANVDDFLSLFQ